MLSTILLLALAADRPPVETGTFRSADLVELVSLDPTIKLDVRYATANNFTGKAVYAQARVFLERPAAEALVRAHKALAKSGYGLLVFDGYRPWSVTKAFWDLTPQDKKVFVADPSKGSKHNRGCAVDLSLYDLATGREVAMPSPYDDMTEKAYATYAGGDVDARTRRDLLRDTMGHEGFFVYPWEWWHFDYKDWTSYPILDLPFDKIAVTSRPPDVDLRTAHVVDLTHTFDATTLYWPTSDISFTLTTVSRGPTPGGWFYAANSFCAPEHGGTHLDAPFHFAEKGRTAEAIEIVAPGIVIDVSAQAASDPDYRLTADDVQRWEKAHGRIPPGAVVLLRTGWSKRWPDRKRTFGDDTPHDATKLHFPSYGKESAELLVDERKVAALGVDTPSIDYGPSKDFIVHRISSARGVPGLENLDALDRVPDAGAWIVALPMKIGGGSGAPLRIVALLP
ncbi:MAG TPA: cyclase family protein [Candidatus Polarisedimenticolaceae bacterium]|nr:cyclase family protein [Candidatus Polarisedimenticolaceae bacterium]